MKMLSYKFSNILIIKSILKNNSIKWLIIIELCYNKKKISLKLNIIKYIIIILTKNIKIYL